jgi:ABC-type bacteriocin/lantibiotic exporter with double-glycine peptidase domain
VPPLILQLIIDRGLQRKDMSALVGWVAVLFGVGVLNAVLAIMRHRTMSKIRWDAAFRTVRVIVRHATRLGAVLGRRTGGGEVVTIGINDVWVIAQLLTITGPGFGAVIAYLVVAVALMLISPLLAIVVLVGVPVVVLVVGPLLGRLQKVGTVYRDGQGALAGRLVDIIGGLRVLGGLGGKDMHANRYRQESQALRAQGYLVGSVTSWIQALGVGLPALFLAVVTWLAARMAVPQEISVGQLVAVYGYAAVLVVPVSSFIEAGFDLSRALVAARRVTGFLTIQPESTAGVDGPVAPAILRDPASGVEVVPGRLTALASARPADSAAVVERLGRFVDSAATWGDQRLDQVAVAEIRDRILVADNDADLFSGTLRQVVAGRWAPDDDAIACAVHAAVATDIVDGLPSGFGSTIAAGGRSLSGGQRQRLRLARALVGDPEVMLAVDPTSAVDAHTEAAMAARLRAARTGRTTVVTSSSPLVLDRADVVYFLVDGRVAATGTHRDLVRDHPGYRSLVARGEVPG